jgi:hypothetical protein
MEAGEGSTQEGRKGKAPLDFKFEMEVRSVPDFIDPPLSPTEGVGIGIGRALVLLPGGLTRSSLDRGCTVNL